MSNYAAQERAKWWPVPAELMAQYCDGSHTDKNWNGSLGWWQNDRHHRDGDLPAVIFAHGSLLWYQNGLIHRDGDKPAVIGAYGELGWWQNNQRHRICGPAVIYAKCKLEWWINGEEITQEVNEWLADEEWQGTPEQIERFQRRFK